VPPENIFLDKQTGTNFDRPQYKLLLARLKPGDCMVIQSLDRLGRNYTETLNQWRLINGALKAAIVVLDMPLLDTRKRGGGPGDLTGQLIADIVLQLLSYVAAQEHENIVSRINAGIAAAKQRGVQFGRPCLPIPKEYPSVYYAWKRGVSAGECGRRLKVSKQTFLKWARASLETDKMRRFTFRT